MRWLNGFSWFVSAAAVEPRGSTEPDVATGHHGGVRAGGSTRGVWREGLGRGVSTYLGECGGRGWGEV